MFSNGPLAIGRKRVFDSVFAPAPLSDISPTPEATPVLGFTGAGESFGGVVASQRKTTAPESDPEPVTWNRAWHTATAYLSIPDKKFELSPGENDDDGRDDETVKLWDKGRPSQEIWDSLVYVGSESSQGRLLRAGSKEHDLVEWYMNEMRRHFLANFRHVMLEELDEQKQDGILQRIVRYLRIAQKIYFTRFLKYVAPLLGSETKEPTFDQLRRSFHAIVAYSLPSEEISYLLAQELATEGLIILGIHNDDEDESSEGLSDSDGTIQASNMEVDQIYSTSYKKWKEEPSAARRPLMMTQGEDSRVTDARSRLLRLLEGLQDVGLGGSKGQKIFAEVMNNMMTEFVASAYAGQWEAPSLIAEHLRQWTENVFARLVVQVLNVFKTTDAESIPEDHLDVTLNDVGRWHDMGISRVGALRISELFDVIVDWDASSGAIEDLKHYTTNPATRFYLTSSFTTILMQRLLQPGASTIEILQVYISIIRAFTQLDPRGVLLDRVARPIRRYLRDREDTVKVIVGGLLSDVNAEGEPTSSSQDTLTELSVELTKAHEHSLRDDSGELDWDDMNWMPDPIDAAPDYKKSKYSDVIGSLISLFETKEAFVKELQKVLSDRLLKQKKDYDLEISVLELLKLRFGDSALQACEVMLRDVLDSKRVDSVIRADQKLEETEEVGDTTRTPDLHAKILSRFFWPTLQDQPFKVPTEILSLQSRYSAGFEALKQSRKLTWLNGLGRATVELDLEDRVFKDEVTTWQATVIYAFQTPSATESSPTTKSVSELSQQLDMTPSLVRSACLFWVSKRILAEPEPDTFHVLETLPPEDQVQSGQNGQSNNTPSPSKPTTSTTANASSAAAAAEAAAAKETADAAAMAKMDLYWQFIQGMLTNQGAMPLQRIIMMLKIAVPGGFPFSSEELREFLGRMVAQGKLEVVSGGSYRIIS